MTITPFIILAVFLFCLGIYVVCTRTNAIGYLMGIELMLNGASVNFVAFSRYHGGNIDGLVMTIFIIALAACESVIALAIVLGIFRHYRKIGTEEVAKMKH
ncbi:MAG: NADH dehydrogenase/oxidoreductase-like protein [uncultured bacterium]|nr:MAG: NADH dehydrogenase/oxidoreductase-like protein [uncultured bacterium]